MRKKVTKKTKMRLSILGTLSLGAIIYFCFTFGYHFYTIYDLKKEKNKLDENYAILQNKTIDLQDEINKLNNKDYLARYAREKYSYSKKGEYIIKMNDNEEKTNDISDTFNNNYIVIGCISGLLFIVIYIFVRSKKNKV